jgi:hypothetical protein
MTEILLGDLIGWLSLRRPNIPWSRFSSTSIEAIIAARVAGVEARGLPACISCFGDETHDSRFIS